MPRNPKLNDLQLILLSTALKRPDGNLLPLPDTVARQEERLRRRSRR